MFTRSGTAWSAQGSELLSNDGVGAPELGFAVALSADGDTAVIGGPHDEGLVPSGQGGAVWVFARSGSSWSQMGPKFEGANEGPGTAFGASASVTADGNTILAGEPGANTAVSFTTPTTPGSPTSVSANPSNQGALVTFSPPASDGGLPITSYTVTASPGGAQASGATSPLFVSGLSNGVTYTFTVTATNSAGTGPASAASNAVTPSGGVGGGGGGGSSSFSLSVSPPSQTLMGGSTATWTISVTNTGGAYLYAVTISDGLAPNCDTPSADSNTLYFMAPTVTVTYSCSLSGVTTNLSNTIVASATTGAGPMISQTVAALVTVEAPFTPPPPAPLSLASPKPSSGGPATLVVSGLETIVLDTSKPKLSLTVRVSRETTLVLTLLSSKGHEPAAWTELAKTGSERLSLLLPLIARHKGRDTLRITETGTRKPKTFPITLRA